MMDTLWLWAGIYLTVGLIWITGTYMNYSRRRGKPGYGLIRLTGVLAIGVIVWPLGVYWQISDKKFM